MADIIFRSKDTDKQTPEQRRQLRQPEPVQGAAEPSPLEPQAQPVADLEREKVAQETKKRIEETTVPLSTGERVPREAYESLTPKLQKQLFDVGVVEFNKITKKNKQKFERENVKLDTGEWIPREIYEALEPENQELINALGVDEFNTEKQADIQNNYIQLSTGEYVLKNDYLALDDDAKEELYTAGVDAYNEYAQDRADKYNEAIKEINAYLVRAAQLSARGWANHQYSDAHLMKLYDSAGNLVNEFFIERGAAMRPSGDGKDLVPVSIGTWDTIYVKKSDPYLLQSGGNTISKEEYDALPEGPEKDQYIPRTQDKVIYMLQTDLLDLWDLNQHLPEGYLVEPTTITYRPDKVNIQHVKVTTPDGTVFGTDLSKAIRQFKEEGILTKPKYIYPESAKTLEELIGPYGEKWNWVNPNTGKPAQGDDVGFNDLIQSTYKRVIFEYDGKTYNMPENEAQKFITISEKIKSTPDGRYELQDNAPYSVFVLDKETGEKLYGEDAYNMVMTGGEYSPYVQDIPYTGPQSGMVNIYQDGRIVSLVNTGTGGYRLATADEIAKAQAYATQAALMAEYMKLPTVEELTANVSPQNAGQIEIIKAGVEDITPKYSFEKIVSDKTTGKQYVQLKDNTLVDRDFFEALPETSARTVYESGTEAAFIKSKYQHDGVYDYMLREEYEKLTPQMKNQFMIGGTQAITEAAIASNTAWILGNVQLPNGGWLSVGQYKEFQKLPDAQQEIYLKSGEKGLADFISRQEDILKPFAYKDQEGKTQIDIISALRAGVEEEKYKTAVESLYNSDDLDKITEGRIIEPKTWQEQLLVYGEEAASPANIQKIANNTVSIADEEGARANNRNEFDRILAAFADFNTDLSEKRNILLYGESGERNPELKQAIARIQEGYDKLTTENQKEFNSALAKMALVEGMVKGFITTGPGVAQVPAGATMGVIEQFSVIPGTIASSIINSSVKMEKALRPGNTPEEMKEILSRSVQDIMAPAAGMLAWFAGRPFALTSGSPYEIGYTTAMILGPEKMSDMARVAKVKIDPRATSNTAVSLEVDVGRIEIPRGMMIDQGVKYLAEVQNRFVEGMTTAFRENRDVVIRDPINGKAIGHATAFQQAVPKTIFHVMPDSMGNIIKEIKQDNSFKVDEGGLYTSQQGAFSYLAKREPSDPAILAMRITENDFAPMPARVSSLYQAGRAKQARNLFNRMSQEGQLEPKLYNVWKTYERGGKIMIENEVWAGPGFEVYPVPSTWYSKYVKDAGTATTYTTSPISTSGKPIARPRATIVLTDKNGNVLLVKDKGRPYSLPGGLIEKGEKPIDTVLRELQEETGLNVVSATKVGRYTDKAPLYDSDGNIVLINGRPAYNQHTVFKAVVDNFSSARPKAELQAVTTAKINDVVTGKGQLEGYVSTIVGKALNKKYAKQKAEAKNIEELRYGQEVPIIWLATRAAADQGLGVPALKQLYKSELIDLVVSARKMLPWNIKLRKVTVDPESPAAGSWIESKLTGITLEAGKPGKTGGTAGAAGKDAIITRADEVKIDEIAKEVETRAQNRKAQGEDYTSAFKEEAASMSDRLIDSQEVAYRPGTPKPRLYLPIEPEEADVYAKDAVLSIGYKDEAKLADTVTMKDEVPVTEKTIQDQEAAEPGIYQETAAETGRELEPIDAVSMAAETVRETGKNEPVKEREAITREAEPTEPRQTSEIITTHTPTSNIITDDIPIPTKTTTIISESEDRYNQLSPKQRDSALAWKQGVMYKYWYEPYYPEEKYTINTPDPIPGVQFHEGLGAAYRSFVALHGDIPKTLRRDMGIFDIEVSRGRDPRKPNVVYTPDVDQKTTIRRGRVINKKGRSSKTRKPGSIEKNGLNFDTLISL